MATVYPSSWEEVKDLRIGWGSKPALILVDVCTAAILTVTTPSDWTDGSKLDLSANPAGAAAPDSMRRVVAAARAAKIPIIWTQVYYAHSKMADAGVAYFKSPGLAIWQVGDTRGYGDCMPGLFPAPEDFIIRKQYPSSFLGTPLNTTLRQLGVDTVVVCGVSTSGCCRATAVDACGHGFRTMMIDESSGDRSAEIQQYTLFDLHSRYADVVSENEAVEKLSLGWQ